MANEQNLRPSEYKLSQEEAKRGGIRSGEVRREKATMKKTLEMLLDEVANIKDNDSKLTYRQLTTLGLLQGAIEGKAENYKTIVQLLGELQEQTNETPSLNINIVNHDDLEKYMYESEE